MSNDENTQVADSSPAIRTKVNQEKILRSQAVFLCTEFQFYQGPFTESGQAWTLGRRLPIFVPVKAPKIFQLHGLNVIVGQ